MFPKHDPYFELLTIVAEINGCNLKLTKNVSDLNSDGICRLCNSDNSRDIEYFLAGLKLQVKDLRKILKGNFADVDYSDRYARAAYLLAYFPFYIEPIYYSTIEHIDTILENKGPELNICFIGGGPLPEFLGLSKAISSNSNIKLLNCYVLDNFQHWSTEREYCLMRLGKYYYQGDFSMETYSFNLWSSNLEILDELKNADIIVMQNCMNDCPADKFHIMKNNIKKIWDNLTNESSFIIIDLYYNTIKDLLIDLSSYFNTSGRIIQNVLSQKRKPNIPKCQHLEELLFENADGLYPKRLTNFYSLVAKKI